MIHQQKNKIVSFIFILMLAITLIPLTPATSSVSEHPLPPPLTVDMTVEKTMMWRMSVRNFTDTPLTDQELGTILYAAYGIRSDENRTIPCINGTYAAHLYVLTNESVYKYNPLNHSLILHKNGDYRSIGQYDAPIQLGIVWDKNMSSDENLTGAEIGAIGQNIQFITTALNLGTVVTAGDANVLTAINLSENEIARVIMPLGHPAEPYNFVYRPFVLSRLPRVTCSGVPLIKALNTTNQTTTFQGELTKQEESQLIWSSYGYSYYFDRSNQANNPVKRHRTVPSAHGYYPLRVYIVTEGGTYRYIPGFYNPLYGLLRRVWFLPVVNELRTVDRVDHRDEIAQACSKNFSSAPMIIIPVLEKKLTKRPYDDVSGAQFLWLWYYEAGAVAYNVFLESSAWNLTANIYPPVNQDSIRDVLNLDENYSPLLVVPVGK